MVAFFGYGSLVDPEKLEIYLNQRDLELKSWRVFYLQNYRRYWGVAMNNSVYIPGYKIYEEPYSGDRPNVYVAFLDIRPEKHAWVNGIVFDTNDQATEILGSRERNYDRIDLFSSSSFVPEPLWTYVGSAEGRQRCEDGALTNTTVIHIDYLSDVIESFKKLGKEEYEFFINETEFRDFPEKYLKRVNT